MKLYFAYGSNMNQDDLRKWCERKGLQIILENPRVVKLAGYKLRFTHYSKCREGGVADIVKPEGTENVEVYGVLFEIDENSLLNLDVKEGVKDKIYRRIPVGVSTENEVFKEVETYEVVEKGKYAPNPAYLDIIIEGAKRYKLPGRYISDLESIRKQITCCT